MYHVDKLKEDSLHHDTN